MPNTIDKENLNNELFEIILIKRELRYYINKFIHLIALLVGIALFASLVRYKAIILRSVISGYNRMVKTDFFIFDYLSQIALSKYRIIITGNNQYLSDQEIIGIIKTNGDYVLNHGNMESLFKTFIKNPVVKNLYISKVASKSELIVHIEEKKIIAITNTCNTASPCDIAQAKLILEDGTLVQYRSNIDTQNLIIVEDLSKVNNFVTLYNSLSKSPIAKDIKNVVSFQSGRWNLIFKNGLVVKLPRNNLEKAIDYLIDIDKQFFILDDNNHIKYIDLRVPNKIYIGE